MFKSVNRLVARMFLLVLALSTTAVAQSPDTAELSGVVLDASGKPAAGHPLNVVTSQWGKVIMSPTEDDGTFTLIGLPPGNYEVLVFSPGGSPDTPVASKKVTLAAGQKERLEIRLGADNPGAATGSPAAGTTLGAIGVDRMTVLTAALVLATGLVIFFVMRSRRRPVE
jgi:hypothetical protein